MEQAPSGVEIRRKQSIDILQQRRSAGQGLVKERGTSSTLLESEQRTARANIGDLKNSSNLEWVSTYTSNCAACPAIIPTNTKGSPRRQMLEGRSISSMTINTAHQ